MKRSSPLLLLLTSACAPAAKPGPATEAPSEGDPAIAEDLSLELDERAPTVLHATWTSAQAETGRLGWRTDDAADWRATDWESSPATDHRLDLIGLPAGAQAQVRVEILEDDGGVAVGEAQDLSVPELPAGFSSFTITADALAEDDDLLLLSVLMGSDGDLPLILNPRGEPVWFALPDNNDRILSVSLSRDGAAVRYTQNPTDYQDTLGSASLLSLNGRTAETVEIDRLHSGVAELPEGGFGFISKQDIEFAGGRLLYDEIWEYVDGESRPIFSILDHFTPGPICSCWDDLVLEGSSEPIYDWTHANSLVLSEDGSAWYLGVRHFDAILKVDRASGDLLWVLGGPYSDFEFEDTDSMFNHQHFSQMTDDTVLVFDNGTHRSPQRSRVAEIHFDQETMKATLTWQYGGQTDLYVPLLGDADRLSDDEVIVSWTTSGLLERVNNEGALLWQASTALGVGVGRVELVPAL